MKYPTKQKRLAALFDAYMKKCKTDGCTTDEVSKWAIANHLYPCPRRGDPEPICEAWERHLAAMFPRG